AEYQALGRPGQPEGGVDDHRFGARERRSKQLEHAGKQDRYVPIRQRRTRVPSVTGGTAVIGHVLVSTLRWIRHRCRLTCWCRTPRGLLPPDRSPGTGEGEPGERAAGDLEARDDATG